ADPAERRLDRGHLLWNDLDDHPPAVSWIGDTPDVAALLEAVDDAGDGAAREPGQLRQPARRRVAHVHQGLERLDVGLGPASPDRDGLPEERALKVHPTQGPDDGIDVVAVHG